MQVKYCKIPGCGYRATWYPVVLVYPKHNGEPAQILVKMALCHKHKGFPSFRSETFITPKGWDNVVASFIANGYAAPLQSRSKLSYVPIEDADIAAEAQFVKGKELKR